MTDTANLVLVCSDWHIGKLCEGYDLKIALARVRELAPRLMDRAKAPATLTVLAAGDLIEGEDIYPMQPWESDGPVIEQVQLGSRAMADMLLEFHRGWKDTDIRVRSVRGNHGRMSKTAHPSSNWDNQLIYDTALRLADVERIDIRPGYDLMTTVSVGPSKVLLMHKGLKHASTPAMQSKLLRACRHYKADIMVGGHWHTAEHRAVDDLHLVCNGALCGADEFGKSLFLFDPARQVFFTVPERGGVQGLDWLEF